jgi:DNA-binding MarR family transcriptional regulator
MNSKAAAVPRSISQPPANRRFGYRINMLSAALSQHRLLQVRREFGINLAEFRILSWLVEVNSTSIRDIAKNSQLDKAHVTRALAGLIKRGLVSQIVDPRDRRLRVVGLTPAGRRIVSATTPYSVERQQRLEKCLSPTELRVFWKALTLLSEEAERMLAEEKRKGTRHRRADDASDQSVVRARRRSAG